jgi:hypothetical protein
LEHELEGNREHNSEQKRYYPQIELLYSMVGDSSPNVCLIIVGASAKAFNRGLTEYVPSTLHFTFDVST